MWSTSPHAVNSFKIAQSSRMAGLDTPYTTCKVAPNPAQTVTALNLQCSNDAKPGISWFVTLIKWPTTQHMRQLSSAHIMVPTKCPMSGNSGG